MDQVDVARVAEYAGEDADATWRIEEILAPKVREEGLWDLYADLERPLISVLAGMEDVGREGRHPAAGRALRRVRRRGWRRSRTRSTSMAGGPVQHQLRARSSARCSSTS